MRERESPTPAYRRRRVWTDRSLRSDHRTVHTVAREQRTRLLLDDSKWGRNRRQRQRRRIVDGQKSPIGSSDGAHGREETANAVVGRNEGSAERVRGGRKQIGCCRWGQWGVLSHWHGGGNSCNGSDEEAVQN